MRERRLTDLRIKSQSEAEATRNVHSKDDGSDAEADVVITNPEHFAVCLAYDPSSMTHPGGCKGLITWQDA